MARGFLKLSDLHADIDKFKPKSLYDLKVKIKDEHVVSVIKYLLWRISKCDIDSDVHFKLEQCKSKTELNLLIFDLLSNDNSRKYDENTRHIFYVLQLLISEDNNEKKKL